jgi:hypothetical protein
VSDVVGQERGPFRNKIGIAFQWRFSMAKVLSTATTRCWKLSWKDLLIC